MAPLRNRRGALVLLGAALMVTAPHLAAQQRMLIPEGTVLTVRTEAALSSTSAQVGQTFRTTLTEPLRMEGGYTVLPAGSVIQGVVTVARPATSHESGIIGVEFNRLTLPNSRSIAIDGKLTSTDPSERRQIESQADSRVVFVGGRRGVGAAIAGIGTTDSGDPVSGVLGAIGSLLSNGTDVNVPPGTTLAVQLLRGLNVSVTGTRTSANPTTDAFTLYTSTEMIRLAQQALKQKDYYRGVIDGQLNDETQRALFEFQIDNRIIATGNLDGRTAQALGLSATASSGSALSPEEAALMRRNAQSLVGQWRSYIGVATTGRLDPRRSYRAADLEAYFALSGFADNASLYEQMVRLSGNADGVAAASQALSASARRVDEALRAASAPARMTGVWESIRDDLAVFDATYRNNDLYR